MQLHELDWTHSIHEYDRSFARITTQRGMFKFRRNADGTYDFFVYARTKGVTIGDMVGLDALAAQCILHSIRGAA